MKFLLDVCVASLRLQDSLAAQGHDVLSALERNPRATDEELLALAMSEARRSVGQSGSAWFSFNPNVACPQSRVPLLELPPERTVRP